MFVNVPFDKRVTGIRQVFEGNGKDPAPTPITVLQPYLKVPILRFTVTRPYILYLTWFKCEKIYQKCKLT